MTAVAVAKPIVRRPRSVVVAVAGMLLMIALGLVTSVAAVVLQDVEGLPDNAVIGTIVATLVLSVLYAVLAAFVLHGRHWARVATWVAGGVLLVPSALGLLRLLIQTLWVGLLYGYLYYALGFFGAYAVLHIAVIVLLAMPSSNRYFRAMRRPR